MSLDLLIGFSLGFILGFIGALLLVASSFRRKHVEIVALSREPER